jgi:hypothetical protein
MPKAAMDKDDGAVFWQNDVRPAGQRLSVEPKAESHPVQQRADKFFGRGVLSADAAPFQLRRRF